MLKKKLIAVHWSLFIIHCVVLFFSAGCEAPDARFREQNQQGDIHFSSMEYEAAITAWSAALEIHPDQAEIYQKMGIAYSRIACPAEAARAFRESLRLEPEKYGVWLELAKIQLASLNAGAAEASWKQAAKRGDTPALYILHGDLMTLKNRLDEAETDYRQAVYAARSARSPDGDLALIRLAICYLAQKREGVAEETYRILEDKQPGEPEIILQMGNYWRLRRDTKKAAVYILKAAQTQPNNLMLQKKLAEFYFNSGEYDNCRNILDKVLRKSPKNRFARKFLAEVLLSQNRMPSAKILLDELSREGEDIELLLLKGKYHLFARNSSSAVTHFLAALEKDPKLSAVHYFLGLAYLCGGQTALARQSFIEVLTLDPDFSQADLALADIYYKEEEYDLCLEHTRRVCVREPENFRAHLIMGNAFLSKGEYAAAVVKFEAVQRLYPQAVSPLYYIAMAAELSGHIEESLRFYQAVLEQHPDLSDAAMQYARLLIRTGNLVTARQFFEDAVKKAPENGILHQVLGEVHLAAGETGKARACFEEAVLVNPKLASAYLRLKEIYEKEGEPDSAISALEACIKNIPQLTVSYTLLAALYQQKGNTAKAEETLRTGMVNNPESPYLANNLAWIYLEQDKELPEALRLALSAYDRLPNEISVADTLGWAYYKNKTLTRAVWILTELCSKKPEHPLPYFHLGTALHTKGDLAGAITNLRYALDNGLKSPQREEAEKIIDNQ
jgi:tetratricopeptide (TPR) repeat protein